METTKEQRERERRERNRRRPCFILEPREIHMDGQNPQITDFTEGEFILVFSPCPVKTQTLTQALCSLGLDYMDVAMHCNDTEKKPNG